MSEENKLKYKVAVIGGGTGLPVILKGLKHLNAYVSAIVTVADDGGSSGVIRDYINVVPPGDIRNCMVALSESDPLLLDVFQYRFDSEDAFLAGHAIGNLIIAALKEMNGSLDKSLEILSEFMKVKGKILPAAQEPLVLNALFEDGTIAVGESQIAKHRKKIKEVSVTTRLGDKAKIASPKVVEAIMEADMIVLGPGSLYTSILPNLMIDEIGEAIRNTSAEVVYICNIMTQLGETESFTDANHVEVLNQHLGGHYIDTVLVNIAEVPEDYILNQPNEEYLLQVKHDFMGLRSQGVRVISNSFLSMKNGGAYHDTELVVEELAHLLDTHKLYLSSKLSK
ncbi:YvcK family protein [Globicatella sp. PHS-GS-PNBC-21-1553]|uniref:gluconeogenesis factor YvcK family protein n=1 Tax=Globicatella sp. PHS-GS-PNBC-21-1553 TaxID=2885764 RepID=UPI00298F01EF|nr:YvcK family protein [Globicatella sp. PHS-GS-PNBC-21-1553]WPC07669.1 YvcK family protein [Globicatella sp. PHS-GS-PNBC-21-1553]